MNLNITLFGQMITFAIFIWFTMKFVWPPLERAMEERAKKIADGLAAAEDGQRQLADAEVQAQTMVADAKARAAEIVEQADRRAMQIVDDAKSNAVTEGQRIIEAAQMELAREVETAKAQLRQRVASIAISAAERLLERNIDAQANQDILDKLVAEI